MYELGKMFKLKQSSLYCEAGHAVANCAPVRRLKDRNEYE